MNNSGNGPDYKSLERMYNHNARSDDGPTRAFITLGVIRYIVQRFAPRPSWPDHVLEFLKATAELDENVLVILDENGPRLANEKEHVNGKENGE